MSVATLYAWKRKFGGMNAEDAKRLKTMLDRAAVRFRDAWRRRIDARYGRVPTHYLSLEDLIAEKEHWARPQDEVDLRALRRVKRRLVARKRR